MTCVCNNFQKIYQYFYPIFILNFAPNFAPNFNPRVDLLIFFRVSDFSALKALLSRAVSNGVLVRVCRGLYLYDKAGYPRGLLLFHAAAYLRVDGLNYLSLETVLSDAGGISQVLIDRITVMSSGRTSEICCGSLGVIEFVHTNQSALDLKDHLAYDSRCHVWRASISLALRDMRVTRRNLDLINWSVLGANRNVRF